MKQKPTLPAALIALGISASGFLPAAAVHAQSPPAITPTGPQRAGSSASGNKSADQTADSQGLAKARERSAKATSQPGESNEHITPQPPRIEESYPLAGDAERAKSVKLLQQVTVDLLALFNDYKQAHWNLNGPLYISLHEYYQEYADYYRKYADIFAERALSLGYSVDGRYATIAKTSTIPDPPAGYQTDNESLKMLIDRVTVLQKQVYESIRATNESDPPTSNKFQDLAYGVDKNLWQLRVFLKKPGGPGQDLPWKGQQGRDRAGE